MLFSENIGVSTKYGIPLPVLKDRNGRQLSLSSGTKKIMNRLYSYILDFELLIVRIAGFVPIYLIRYLVYLAAGVKIHRKAHLHMGTQFFYPAGVEIGEGSIIGQNAFLDGRDKLKIGKHVDIASDVMIYNSEHDINSEDFDAITATVEIGDYCFIGPRAIILPGVKIGEGSVVAAGGVVTKNVEDFKIVGGVPAQVIGVRKISDPKYRLGRTRLFQ